VLLATYLFVLVGCCVALGGSTSSHHQEATGGVKVVAGRATGGRWWPAAWTMLALGAARELILMEDAVATRHPVRRYAASGAIQEIEAAVCRLRGPSSSSP
jgi:hypothetical protein